MKKLFTALLALTLMGTTLGGCAPASDGSSDASLPLGGEEQGVPTPVIKNLGVGTMLVYDFGDIQLHAYETKDALGDENFILETADELVLIEVVGFTSNIEELQAYIQGLGKPLNNVVVAYHPAGADAYAQTTMHAAEGFGEAALIPGFIEIFGEAFNGSVPAEFELVEAGSVTIGGVALNVIQTADAFDIEIPAIGVYMTHMVGASTHNILPSIEAIDAMAAQMQQLKDKNYNLILSGHDVPRTIEITDEKLAYLKTFKELALSSASADEFTAAVNAEFPDYAGANYLEMSVGGLFAG